jgi:ATP-binding cassette subfamily B protein
VLAQASVGPGGSEQLDLILAPGTYRLRARGVQAAALLEARAERGASGPDGKMSASLTAAGVELSTGSVAAGPLSLEVLNRDSEERLLLLEAGVWPDDALTAAAVCTLQEFRELFPSEAPPPGVELGVASLAFMALEPGGVDGPDDVALDDAAMAIVRAAVDAHGGALMGTGSDSSGGRVERLLAAFLEAEDALRAALRVQRDLNSAHGAGIGLHGGPCVALSRAGVLTYAGASVDATSELARRCRGGQIVVSSAAARAELLAELVEIGCSVEHDRIEVRVGTESITAHCIDLPEGTDWELVVDRTASSRASLDWLRRSIGPLALECRRGSYAAERLESIAGAYDEALERIRGFLGRDPATLASMTVRLVEAPADGASDGPEARVTRVVVTAESPGPAPESVLVPLVLHEALGSAKPEALFWEDGLAGHLAAEGGSEQHVEASSRLRALQEAGQLLPLADLARQRQERRSRLGELAASAFTQFLVGWRGRERYCRLLRVARSGEANAFRRVYGRPLQAVEAQWLRALEAGGELGRRATLGALRDLLPYFRAYRAQLFAILIMVLVGLSFDLFTPLALRFLVDNILARQPLTFAVPGLAAAGERIAPDEQVATLFRLLAVMVGMFLLNAFARMRQSLLLATISEGVTLDLRRRFLEQLQRLPTSFHARTSTTEISQRFFTDIGQVPAALSTGLVLISNGLAMLLFGSTLLSINLKLGLVAIAGLPLFVVAARRGRTTTRQMARERGRRATEIQQALFENLAGQRYFRLLNARGPLLRRFDDRLEVHREMNVRAALLGQAFTRASGLITNAAQVAVLVVGGLIVITTAGQELSPGGLMAFYLLLLRFYLPAVSFTGAIQTLELAADALTRLRKVLNLPTEADSPEAKPIGPLSQRLALEAVELIQPSGKAELRGLTAEIVAGSQVAFVGAAGSGSASLLALLPRLEEPTAGRILWDGVDAALATHDSLRAQVTVLSQDSFVLRATIYDNLRLGRPEATEAEVLAAASAAGLHELVSSVPNGYDTLVSDRDTLLSAELRQRLSVAQALLRDASVIVLSDALGALSAEEQRRLTEALRGPDRRKTVIQVAKRPSAVTAAARIYVLDEGQVVESGTHDELVELRGVYAQLVREELGDVAVSGARQAARRLSRLAPFSSLPAETLDELAKLMLFMERSAGQEIVRQGSVGDELYIVGRGEVEVAVIDELGQERVVNVLGEADYFGEISFLRRTPRTATIRARVPSELHLLRRLDFDYLLDRLDASLLSQIETTARARIEDTRAKLAELSA